MQLLKMMMMMMYVCTYVRTYLRTYVPTYVCMYCLFDLIFYVPSTIFQLYRDGSSWVEPVLSFAQEPQRSDAGEARTLIGLKSRTLPQCHCAHCVCVCVCMCVCMYTQKKSNWSLFKLIIFDQALKLLN